MSARILDELTITERGGKPRDTGLTVALDEFRALDWELLGEGSSYIDYVMIPRSIPLLLQRSKLLERVRRFHDFGIKVLGSGTLVAAASYKGAFPQVARGLKDIGFDALGVRWLEGRSEGTPVKVGRETLEEISRLSMEPFVEVGGGVRTETKRMIAAIRDAAEVKGCKVIVQVPSAEGGQRAGRIDREALNEIAGTFGPPNLIFEAPTVSQSVELILEFGPAVNLSGVSLDDVLTLEMHRLGLTMETLGTSRPVLNVEGSPAAKFVYHLVRAEHPIDQSTLILRSGLPRRTVQGAISFLVEKGLLRELADTSDMRRHRYTPS